MNATRRIAPHASQPKTTTIKINARIPPGTTSLALELIVNNTAQATIVDKALLINNADLADKSPDAAIATSVRYDGKEEFCDPKVTLPEVIKPGETTRNTFRDSALGS